MAKLKMNVYNFVKRSRHCLFVSGLTIFVFAVFVGVVYWISKFQPYSAFDYPQIRNKFQFLQFKRNQNDIQVYHPKFPRGDNIPYNSRDEYGDLSPHHDSENSPISQQALKNEVRKKREIRVIKRNKSSNNQVIKRLLKLQFKDNDPKSQSRKSSKPFQKNTGILKQNPMDSNSTERFIKWFRDTTIKRRKRQTPSNSGKTFDAQVGKLNETSEPRQSRIIPSIIDLLPSWLGGKGNNPSSDNHNIVTTFKDQPAELQPVTTTPSMKATLLPIGFENCDDCDFEEQFTIEGLENTSETTFENSNYEECNACDDSSERESHQDVSEITTFDMGTTPEFAVKSEALVTAFNVNTGMSRNSTESQFRDLTFLPVNTKNVQDVDNQVTSIQTQTESLFDQFSAEKEPLISSENLGSGELFSEAHTTEKNDWLLNYCFEKLLNRKLTNELTPSPKMEKRERTGDNINDSINDLQTSNSPLLRYLDVFLKLEQKELESGPLANNSERGARHLGTFTKFFDFFGSGRSARMSDENADSINDVTDEPQLDQFDDLKFAGEECMAFFQSILRSQTRIAKPNLVDLMSLGTEFTETPSTTQPHLITPNIIQTSTDTSSAFPLTEDNSNLTQRHSLKFTSVDSLDFMNDQSSFSDSIPEITQTEEGIMKNFDRSATSTREGRFLSIFGFGSGSDDLVAKQTNENSSNKNSDRSFFGNFFNFDSGGGSVDETPTIPSALNNLETKSQRRLWNIFNFGSGDSRELSSSVTSSERIIPIHQFSDHLSDQSIESTPIDINEFDIATTKLSGRIFDLFDSSDFRLSENEYLTTTAIPASNPGELKGAEINTQIHTSSPENSLHNKDTERFFGSIFDIGSGESRDLNLKSEENELTLTTEFQQRMFFGSLFNAGSGERRNVQWESTEGNFVNLTESESFTTNQVDKFTESHRFFGGFFGSGDERSFEKSRDVSENVGSFNFMENKTDGSNRFFFVPDFGSGEIVFEPQGEKESPPPPAERRFFGNFFDFGSGEGRAQTIEVADSTEIQRNTESEKNISTVNWTDSLKLSKRVGDINVTELNVKTETIYIQENSSTYHRFRSREQRFEDEPEIQCNEYECEYDNADFVSSKPENSTKNQISFAKCDENSCHGEIQPDLPSVHRLKNTSENPDTFVNSDDDSYQNMLKDNSSNINNDTEHEGGIDVSRLNRSTEFDVEYQDNDVLNLNATFEELKHRDNVTCIDDCEWGLIAKPTGRALGITEVSENVNNDNEYVTHHDDNEQQKAPSKTAISNPYHLSSRSCSRDSQCDNFLNERCTFNGSVYICGCGRSFARHMTSGKCEPKIILETILRFPNEAYSEELKDPESQIYKEKMMEANEVMRLLVNDNIDLKANVAEYNVTAFSEGSLVIHWQLVVTALDNETSDEVSKNVRQAINETLTHKWVLEKAPLKTENVTILRISLAVNPCQISDLNYCSSFADCVTDNNRPGGFLCQCKAGTLDYSKHRATHPGELCQVVCPSNYCGQHGTCKVNKDGDKECLCMGWYLGDRCETSGVVLIIVIAVANILLVLLVFLCVFCVKMRRRRSGYGSRHRAFVRTLDYGFGESGNTLKVTDIVALSERPSIPTKFNQISWTPAQMPSRMRGLPEIKVIPPSVSEFSYSNDSSFDTPSEMSIRSDRSVRSSQMPNQFEESVGSSEMPYRFEESVGSSEMPNRFEESVGSSEMPNRFEESIGSSEMPNRFEESVGSSEMPNRFEESVGSSEMPNRFEESVGSSEMPNRFEESVGSSEMPNRFEESVGSSEMPNRFEESVGSSEMPNRFEESVGSSEMPNRFEESVTP